MFYFVRRCYCSSVVLEYIFDLRLVSLNGSDSSLYFLHSNTSGQLQLEDAPSSAMAVFTFRLRNFHFSSASFISALIAMFDTSQICSWVDFHPVGNGIWLVKFGLACSLTWQGGGATGDSGFLYDFAIILMLATFMRFRVTIFHCPSSYYSPSAAKSFSSCACLFFFHCTGSSLLIFLSSKFLSLLNHCLFL